MITNYGADGDFWWLNERFRRESKNQESSVNDRETKFEEVTRVVKAKQYEAMSRSYTTDSPFFYNEVSLIKEEDDVIRGLESAYSASRIARGRPFRMKVTFLYVGDHGLVGARADRPKTAVFGRSDVAGVEPGRILSTDFVIKPSTRTELKTKKILKNVHDYQNHFPDFNMGSNYTYLGIYAMQVFLMFQATSERHGTTISVESQYQDFVRRNIRDQDLLLNNDMMDIEVTPYRSRTGRRMKRKYTKESRKSDRLATKFGSVFTKVSNTFVRRSQRVIDKRNRIASASVNNTLLSKLFNKGKCPGFIIDPLEKYIDNENLCMFRCVAGWLKSKGDVKTMTRDDIVVYELFRLFYGIGGSDADELLEEIRNYNGFDIEGEIADLALLVDKQIFIYEFLDDDLESHIFSKRIKLVYKTMSTDDVEYIERSRDIEGFDYEDHDSQDAFDNIEYQDICNEICAMRNMKSELVKALEDDEVSPVKLSGERVAEAKEQIKSINRSLFKLCTKEYMEACSMVDIDYDDTIHIIYHREKETSKGHAMLLTRPRTMCETHTCLKCGTIFNVSGVKVNRQAIVRHLVDDSCFERTVRRFTEYPQAYFKPISFIRELLGKEKLIISKNGLHTMIPDTSFLVEAVIMMDMEVTMPLCDLNGSEIKATNDLAVHRPFKIGLGSNIPKHEGPFFISKDDDSTDMTVMIEQLIDKLCELSAAGYKWNRKKFRPLLNTLQAQGEFNKRKKLLKKLEVVPVMTLNGSRYDIKLLYHDLLRYEEDCISKVPDSEYARTKNADTPEKVDKARKKELNDVISSVTSGSNIVTLTMSNYHIIFKDITSILPGTSYAQFLAMYAPKDDNKKGFYPYELCVSVEWAKKEFPVGGEFPYPIEGFFSKLKNANTLGDTRKEQEKNYEIVKSVWREGAMTTMEQYTDYYLSLDITPGVKAVVEMQRVYSATGHDTNHDVITMAALAEKSLAYSIEKENMEYINEDEDYHRILNMFENPYTTDLPSVIDEKDIPEEYIDRLYNTATIINKAIREKGVTSTNQFRSKMSKMSALEDEVSKLMLKMAQRAYDGYEDAKTGELRHKYIPREGEEVWGGEQAMLEDISKEELLNTLKGQRGYCTCCNSFCGSINLIPRLTNIEYFYSPYNTTFSCKECCDFISTNTFKMSMNEIITARTLVKRASDRQIMTITDENVFNALKVPGGPCFVFNREFEVGVTKNSKGQILMGGCSLDANMLYPFALQQNQVAGDLLIQRFKTLEEPDLPDPPSIDDFMDSVRNDKVYGFFVVDIYLPKKLWNLNKFRQLQPLFETTTIKERPDVIGDYSFDLHYRQKIDRRRMTKAERLAIADDKRSIARSDGVGCIPTLLNVFRARKVTVDVELLKLYDRLGLKVKKIHSIISGQPHKSCESFIRMCVNTRRYADYSAELANYNTNAKLMANSCFGKTAEKKDTYDTTTFNTDPKSIGRAISSSRFVGGYSIPSLTENKEIAVLKSLKRYCKMDMPHQIATKTFLAAKRRMLEFYYDFIDHFSDGGSELFYMDTDCFIFGWPIGWDFEHCVPDHLMEEYKIVKRSFLTPKLEESIHDVEIFMRQKINKEEAYASYVWHDDITTRCLNEFMTENERIVNLLDVMTCEERVNPMVIEKLAKIFGNFIGKEPGLFKLEYVATKGYYASSKCYHMSFEGEYKGELAYKIGSIDMMHGPERFKETLLDPNCDMKSCSQYGSKVSAKGISKRRNKDILTSDNFKNSINDPKLNIMAGNMTFQKNVNNDLMVTQLCNKKAISSKYIKKKLRSDGVTCDPLVNDPDDDEYWGE